MTVVRLSVHKNNKKPRERKALRKLAVAEMKECMKSGNISGYCIVSWDDDKTNHTAWDMLNNSPIAPWEIPRFFANKITRSIHSLDIDNSK